MVTRQPAFVIFPKLKANKSELQGDMLLVSLISPLLVLNGASFDSDNALLALNWLHVCVD